MKLARATSLAAVASLAVASPIKRDSEDTVNDMQDVISGSAPCAAVGALFARGTFDSGNVGVWVGPDFVSGIQGALPSVAAQGVDSDAYPADLDDYLSEGGSNAGAASMAQTAADYAKQCPNSTIVLAGWSQGALVAHKALEQLDDATKNQVAGLVTFGDPWHLFNTTTPSLPANQLQGYCVTGTVFDPLCADLPEDFKVPTSIGDILGPFKDLPSVVKGLQETKAAASLVAQFPVQLAESWSAFVKNLNPQDFTRALLTPQHFTYGNTGMAGQAATWAAGLDKVKAATA